MAISSDAIKSFLERDLPHVPKFKGMPKDELLRHIQSITGRAYNPKTEPRQHQIEGLALGLHLQRALLFFAPRVGKSLNALHWAEHLKSCGAWRGKGLVITHAPVGLDVWKEEVQKHSRLKLICVQNNALEFCDALESDADLIATPWSGLQAIFSEKRLAKRGKRAGQPKLYANLAAAREAAEAFDLCIMDEIHRCKNAGTLRFQIASEIIRDCTFRMGLTGTPIGRDNMALWAQTYLIDEGETLGRNYFFFEQAFGKKKKNWFAPNRYDWVFDKKKLPILKTKLDTLSMSYKRSEIRTEDVRPAIIDLPMGKKQQIAYDKEVDDLIETRKDETSERKNIFVRLRQISSGFLPFVDDYGISHIQEFPDNAKLAWLDEFLEDIDKDFRFIIFHEFTYSGEMICRLLQKHKVGHTWLYGGTKDRTHAVQSFRTKKTQGLVANTGVGGEAIDLHMADYMLFFECPTAPITRQQCEARPMAEARGAKALYIDDMACSPTERRILGFIREGRAAYSALMANPKLAARKLDKKKGA